MECCVVWQEGGTAGCMGERRAQRESGRAQRGRSCLHARPHPTLRPATPLQRRRLMPPAAAMCRPCRRRHAGALVGELTDPNLTTICPVNLPHPRLDLIGKLGRKQTQAQRGA